MTKISVTLPEELQERIDRFVSEGVGSDAIDVIRQALAKLAEDETARGVRISMQEIHEGKVLRGDPREVLLG